MPIEIFVFGILGFVLLFAMAVRVFVNSDESREELIKLRKHLDLLAVPSKKKSSSIVETTILFGETFEEVADKIRSKISPELKISQGITLQKKTGKYTAVLERVMRWDKEGERFI